MSKTKINYRNFGRETHESKPLTSGSIVTLQIPTGKKIQSLIASFTTSAGAAASVAAIKSEISNIRLTVNGQDIINASPTKLFDVYQFMGVGVNTPAGIAGALELLIGKLIYDSQEVRRLFGMGTRDVDVIQLSITCGTLVTIANAQTFTLREDVTELLGSYISIINYAQSFNSAAEHIADTLPKGGKENNLLTALVSPGASGVISFGELRISSRTVREKAPPHVNNAQMSNNGHAVPTGYYIHNFCHGSLDEVLPLEGVTDLRFFTTFSTAPGAAGYDITLLNLSRLAQ